MGGIRLKRRKYQKQSGPTMVHMPPRRKRILFVPDIHTVADKSRRAAISKFLSLVEWLAPLGLGIAMGQWDEFGAAILCFVVSAIVLLVKIVRWEGTERRGWVTQFFRGISLVLWAIAFSYMGLVTYENKDIKPWSKAWSKWVEIPDRPPVLASRFPAPDLTPTPHEDSVLSHPVIAQSGTKVILGPNRDITVMMTLENKSDFETVANVNFDFFWNGKIPNRLDPVQGPRSMAIAAHDHIEVGAPLYLTPTDYSKWESGAGQFTIVLTADYPDKGKRTRYTLRGRILRNGVFDLLSTKWKSY